MSDPAPAPRRARLEDALRALLDDADAFGVLGFGAERAGLSEGAPSGSGASPEPAGDDAGESTMNSESALALRRGAEVPPTSRGSTGATSEVAASPSSVPAASTREAASPARGLTSSVVSHANLGPPQAAAAPHDDSDATRLVRLAEIAAECSACRRCSLGGLRTNAVPGQGNPRAEIFFVGEAPGADEDLQGLAFVGAAGQLLTKMILAMGYAREDVFIANVLKCRPPGNRDPAPEEVAACRPFLKRQLEIVRPRIVCALGGHASRALLETDLPVGRLRGRAHDVAGIPAVVTYHPAYLLRSPQEKTKAWDDLKFLLKLLGKEPPARPKASGPEPVA